MLAQQAPHQLGVADIATHERVAAVAVKCRQVGGIAGVGQQVKVEKRVWGTLRTAQNEVGADKTSSASHQ